MAEQLTFDQFGPELEKPKQPVPILQSANTRKRDQLEYNFGSILTTAIWLDRTLISYQANKAAPFYRWFKYREGFAAAMVERVLQKLFVTPGKLLDPFAGAGSALFAARDLGWKTTGIELLPPGQLAIETRLAAEQVDSAQFESAVRMVSSGIWKNARPKWNFRHIRITEKAFPGATEKNMNAFMSWVERSHFPPKLACLLRFAAFCVLEDISFTRKDGQYLRWDTRSGRTLGKGFHKGPILEFETALLQQLSFILDDLTSRHQLFVGEKSKKKSGIDLKKGSCLQFLPKLEPASFDCIFTSPPYCNRYDYTRTYALELAFLGCDEEKVKSLRQEMVFCTVENKEKPGLDRPYGGSRKYLYTRATTTFQKQEALHEVLDRLESHRLQGLLNNEAIVKLVRNYFFEMALVLSSCASVLKRGGYFIMVNDNVRYAGEIVPVDLILSDFAARFGMKPVHVWKLGRGKGNSSQQMGAHGRTELRKSVCVWQKQ